MKLGELGEMKPSHRTSTFNKQAKLRAPLAPVMLLCRCLARPPIIRRIPEQFLPSVDRGGTVLEDTDVSAGAFDVCAGCKLVR